MARGRCGGSWVWMAAVLACERPAADPAESHALPATPAPTRARVASIRVRFDNGRPEFGKAESSEDRLRAVAVFADADPRDRSIVLGLVGGGDAAGADPGLDGCVRQGSVGGGAGAAASTRPASWIQLMDVGNLELRAGNLALPLQIRLLPAVVDATRGVRYEAVVERGRGLLAAGTLRLSATGGDGMAAFSAEVAVPRPVRISFVGDQPPETGLVRHLPPGELRVRWGSVDGRADLELLAGSETTDVPVWLRCRPKDDGEFVLPAGMVAQLPPRSPQRPWTLMVVRRSRAAVPGFGDGGLTLEVADAVHVE
ncbi:MAG: hypothetical protein FJ100_04375 [Deltaproteobacteria bacterium]|nr:hypothetical protein [Deltaproteobacteria bacterium]